jgi:nicotinamidase/pyrazinamidase
MTATLIALDPQMDYLPGGSIDAFRGLEAIRHIAFMADYVEKFILTRDWHPEDHFTFNDHPMFRDQSWPPHCVQGTKGAKIYSALRKRADFTISKGMSRNPPDDYSAFNGKTLRPVEDLPEILRRSPTDDIIVCGFLLEIGVKYTAFDANALGWWDNVYVPIDATGTLDTPLEQQKILEPMTKAGIQVVESWEEVLNRISEKS